MTENHVSICICTYQRPVMLKRLLDAVGEQEVGDLFTFSIVVVDNDAARSAEPVVTSFSQRSKIGISYHTEPRRNIALARNKTVAEATGHYIVFVDDDEFPVKDWLAQLFKTCAKYKSAGVLGPVRPHFDEPPPAWVVRGKFCERTEHPTGTVMAWTECRTGNVLFRREILPSTGEPFDEKFGTGGEDKDFFMRMSAAGRVFVWCNEAIVHESVPANRCTRGYMLNRALLRGKNSLKINSGRVVMILKSLVAVPLYSLLLPFTVLFGQHRFMQYCIRLCDHLGRVLALVGLHPLNERKM